MIPVSVVIPTCNRPQALIALLDCLSHSADMPQEIIIVDSGDRGPGPEDYARFGRLSLVRLPSRRSLCSQRNSGILAARSPWIFICDDDMEVPPDYLRKLWIHIERHPEAGAVSGRILQQVEGQWQAAYPIYSSRELLFRYVFGLGIWGNIQCADDNGYLRKIKRSYARKGNHIARSGWPVITAFPGEYFKTPVWGLGASLIRKEWLLGSLYDERLEAHGAGDHYGVASGFPAEGIHVVNEAVVYHHASAVNRLEPPRQYLLRILALDYFREMKPWLGVHKGWLLWSLCGSLLLFLKKRDLGMARAALHAIGSIARGHNPYYRTRKSPRPLDRPLVDSPSKSRFV